MERSYQRTGSRLACVYGVMDAHGKFGEHARTIRVARKLEKAVETFAYRLVFHRRKTLRFALFAYWTISLAVFR